MHRPQSDWPGLVALEVQDFRRTADGVTPEAIVTLRAHLVAHCERLADWKRGDPS